VTVFGISNLFWETLESINRNFPLGLDAWFISDRWLLGIPRSTRIKILFEEGAWVTRL
jgi:alpha-D-ribose 1-methylphosphonate 5-triphosphate synthase subunit PhnH